MTEQSDNKQSSPSPADPETAEQARAASPIPAEPGVDELREKCIEAVKNVYDPEIPVNIYELGLIYDVEVTPERNVNVKMTLTSPACPAAQDLPLEVRGRIAVIPGVNEVEVDIVFDPPWSPAKMSEAAKVQLGMDL